MIEGRPGGGGIGVTVCCARRTGGPSSGVCAGVHPRPRINTPMASLEFTRTPSIRKDWPYSTPVEVWRARRPTMREIVIDTETTRLDSLDGHRIIEIGEVELINRSPTGQTFRCYLWPGAQHASRRARGARAYGRVLGRQTVVWCGRRRVPIVRRQCTARRSQRGP